MVPRWYRHTWRRLFEYAFCGNGHARIHVRFYHLWLSCSISIRSLFRLQERTRFRWDVSTPFSTSMCLIKLSDGQHHSRGHLHRVHSRYQRYFDLCLEGLPLGRVRENECSRIYWSYDWLVYNAFDGSAHHNTLLNWSEICGWSRLVAALFDYQLDPTMFPSLAPYFLVFFVHENDIHGTMRWRSTRHIKRRDQGEINRDGWAWSKRKMNLRIG